MSSNVLPLHLKQTFPLIIWIFTEGDGIESRLPFKIFSTLPRLTSTYTVSIRIFDIKREVLDFSDLVYNRQSILFLEFAMLFYAQILNITRAQIMIQLFLL